MERPSAPCWTCLLLLLLLSRFSRVRLCDLMDGQPTRLPRPWDSPGKNTGVGCHFLLQCMKVKRVKSLSHVRLLATPWISAHQAPPSMGFSRREYWSGVPLPSPAGRVYSLGTRSGDDCQCFLVPPMSEGSCYSYQTTSRYANEQGPMGPSRAGGVCGVVRPSPLSLALGPF